MCFGHIRKDVAINFQGLWLLCLGLEKCHVDQAIQVHLISKTMSFWVYV